MCPVRHLGLETHQNIKQQRRPELPLDSLFVVAKEITHLQGLLELFEKHLDAPAGLVEFADTAGGPLHVVGDENHRHFHAVDGDEHFDAAQPGRVLLFAFGRGEDNEVVAQYLALGFVLEFLHDPVSHVVLGPGDPENPAQAKAVKMEEIDVGLVEQGDLAREQMGAEGGRTRVVVVGGLLDDHEARQEALQVEAQVHLGCRLAPPVLGPGHAVGHQGNGCRVHGMDDFLEPPWQSFVARPKATRRALFKMLEDLPEERLHHFAVTGLVGMGEGVACGGNRPPQASQPSGVVAQGIANVIESNGVGKLGVEQADNVTPRGECPRFFIDPILAGKLCNKMRGNELAELG